MALHLRQILMVGGGRFYTHGPVTEILVQKLSRDTRICVIETINSSFRCD